MNLEQHVTPRTVQDIYDWYVDQRKSEHRPHLGGSQIGGPCDRALFYQFRHADRAVFDGRMLRLFETGDREEGRIVANLRAVGMTVWDRDPDTGKQIRFTDCGGHFALSLDGVVEGVPESKVPHTAEFKTASDKNFRAIKSKGIEAAKPVYWAQAQVGMHKSGLTRCLFIVVNKNTDELYIERIRYDPAIGMKLIARAASIIFAEQPPARISTDPAYFECKWCTFQNVCHKGKIPEINCRTCAHATPEKDGDGAWSCSKGNAFGTVCSGHIFNPYMMPWEIDDAGPDWVQYVTGEGEVVRNGNGNSLSVASMWVPF